MEERRREWEEIIPEERRGLRKRNGERKGRKNLKNEESRGRGQRYNKEGENEIRREKGKKQRNGTKMKIIRRFFFLKKKDLKKKERKKRENKRNSKK